MPIIQINISKSASANMEIDPAKRFAELMDIPPEQVTVYVSLNGAIYGNQYECIVHLHLPDLWKRKTRKRMLATIQQVIKEAWSIDPKEIIAIIHLVKSGLVMDRGKVEKW